MPKFRLPAHFTINADDVESAEDRLATWLDEIFPQHRESLPPDIDLEIIWDGTREIKEEEE
jgi:hypothetical protein